MSKITIALLAGMLNVSVAIAQDFRPGFILKLNGDSLAGFVDNRSDKLNSRMCYFKSSRGGKKEKYLPTELKGYGLMDDKFYESKEITIIENESVRRATYFIEVLVKGKASLYKYHDVFYLERDSLFLLPKDSLSEVTVQGQAYLKSSNKYVALLNIALADCNLRADKIKYEERGLTYLIQNYNRCKGAAGLTYKATKSWTKFGVGLFLGMDQSNIKLNGYNEYSWKQNISMPIGTLFEISSPRLSDKGYFNIEVWFVKKLYQGYSEVNSAGSTVRTDLSLNASFLKIPIGFRINLSQERQTPYIKFGMVQYFTLKTNAQVLSETENNGIVTTNRYSGPIDSKNQLGVWMGAGFVKKMSSKVSGFLEVRYERNNGFTQSSLQYSSSGSVLNFLIGLKY